MTNSLSERLLRTIARDSGASSRQLRAWFRRDSDASIDAALLKLKSRGAIGIANGVWFVRQPWLARVSGIPVEEQ